MKQVWLQASGFVALGAEGCKSGVVALGRSVSSQRLELQAWSPTVHALRACQDCTSILETDLLDELVLLVLT